MGRGYPRTPRLNRHDRRRYDRRIGNVLAFAGVAALIVVVPGPDMALVLRNGIALGRRAAVATALGINTGLLVWALAAALGIAAVLHASATAFTVLKLAGAVYLVWLGARALLDAWRGISEPSAASAPRRRASPFRQGLLSNLFNPKIALVYTTLIPQFVDRGGSEIAQTFLLAAVFIAMGLVWLTGYALLVAQAGALLRRPAVRRGVNAVSGVVLTALGVRLAFERR
jgi:threonine/homoserine/homoserine lactone efflux protein